MYQYKAGLSPKCFDNICLETNQVHGYNTRSSKSFYTFSCRTNIRQFSIRFQGPKFFNSLSSDIKTSISIFSFKSKLKSFLLSWYLFINLLYVSVIFSLTCYGPCFLSLYDSVIFKIYLNLVNFNIPLCSFKWFIFLFFSSLMRKPIIYKPLWFLVGFPRH